MSVSRKLTKWTDARLLSEEQAQKILEYEKNKNSGRLLKGIYGLGAFAILVGVLAIIAANWQVIPPYTKVFVHLVINAFLAYGIYYFDFQKKNTAKELCVFALTGLTLTLIALIGQVFHLNGSIASALVLWMVLITPFAIFYGDTKISLAPWLLGFIAAIFAGIHEYVFPYLGDADKKIFAVGVAAFLPIAFIYVSQAIEKIGRPVLQKLLFYTGIAGGVAVPNIACQFWYDTDFRDFIGNSGAQITVLGIFILAVASVFAIKIANAKSVLIISQNTRLLLLGGLLASCLPFAFSLVESKFMAAASFIIYWLFLGFIGHKTDRQGLVSASIVIVAIRIYVIYLEVFGSMLETGFGLVVSGLLLIGMVWGVRQINKSLEMVSLEGGSDE